MASAAAVPTPRVPVFVGKLPKEPCEFASALTTQTPAWHQIENSSHSQLCPQARCRGINLAARVAPGAHGPCPGDGPVTPSLCCTGRLPPLFTRPAAAKVASAPAGAPPGPGFFASAAAYYSRSVETNVFLRGGHIPPPAPTAPQAPHAEGLAQLGLLWVMGTGAAALAGRGGFRSLQHAVARSLPNRPMQAGAGAVAAGTWAGGATWSRQCPAPAKSSAPSPR